MRRFLIGTFVLAILVIPTLGFAQSPESSGIVPCNGPECQACHFIQLGNNLLRWTIGIMASVIALVFVFGGLRMVMSAGDTHAVSEARGMMTNSIIGFVILLAAWLVIDTLLKVVVNDSDSAVQQMIGVGMWNKIECVAYVPWVKGTSRPVVGGGTTGTLTPAQTGSRLSRTGTYKDQLCENATAEGISNQCGSLQAIMAIESDSIVNAVSPVGALGLMQIMPDTARGLDPSLSGLSDLDIRIKLEDPTYNIQLGTRLYANLYEQYNGDLPKVYAAYNGGPTANEPSENCAGQLKWQCAWDDSAHTVPNTGYAETRNYVRNVELVRCSIPNAQGC